jgi:hypothetical protein
MRNPTIFRKLIESARRGTLREAFGPMSGKTLTIKVWLGPSPPEIHL